MMMLVYRDTEGRVLNIGEWDQQVITQEDGTVVMMNAIPEGTTHQEEAIITLPDGGMWPAADPLPAWAAALSNT
jgi:hypothetical protein